MKLNNLCEGVCHMTSDCMHIKSTDRQTDQTEVSLNSSAIDQLTVTLVCDVWSCIIV